MRKPIYITGCGCSGTKYIAKAMNRAGLHFPHEGIGRDGCASWYLHVGNDPFKKKGGTGINDFPRPPVILHQTRHPLKVISSFQRVRPMNGFSWTYIRIYLPQIKIKEHRILQCMKYWYHWTNFADKLAEWQYRVESIEEEEVFEEFCRRIDRPEFLKIKKSMLNVSKLTNSFRKNYRPLSWGQLEDQDFELTEKIRKKGRRYGYDA